MYDYVFISRIRDLSNWSSLVVISCRFPTLIWFENQKRGEYTGGRTTQTIVDWVRSMCLDRSFTVPMFNSKKVQQISLRFFKKPWKVK